MFSACFAMLQYALPQHWLSRLLGKLMNCEQPAVKQWLINRACQHYHIDLSEAAQPDPTQYKSFNAFFTRQLKADARPIDRTPNTLCSPADGVISQCGLIRQGTLLQAKGREFHLTELLGGETTHAQALKAGQFATIYLSPHDYHRVYLPYDGQLTDMVYVPGQLFSVNQATTQHIPHLFARNERVIAFFETEFGPMAIVMVGAMLVASIETVWHGVVNPPAHRDKKIHHFNYKKTLNHHYQKGQEIGNFHFGSTVIVIVPKHAPSIVNSGENAPIKMGSALI